MYVADGIAYAGERAPEIKVCGVRPLAGHKLWLRFTTGEAKVFDFAPLLEKAAFAPLGDELETLAHDVALKIAEKDRR